MMENSEKRILKRLWKLQFLKGIISEDDLKRTGADPGGLISKRIIYKSRGGYKLSSAGRKKIKIVACGGVFDILHPGHGFILEKSKELGDLLVVIVARDSTVMKRKRIPIVPEEQRLEMVKYLKHVDLATLGEEGDYLKIIERIAPDIIALGPDQHHDANKIKSELETRGLRVEVVRVEEYKEAPLHSTRDILRRIIERDYPR
jgi:FAD synthetase